MSHLMPTDIVNEVAAVLRQAAHGDGTEPNYLTAYQILDRLPTDIRDRLIRERTIGGQGAGVAYAAPSVVSDAAEKVPGIQIEYLATRGLVIEVAGQQLRPGFEVCGLYRLRE